MKVLHTAFLLLALSLVVNGQFNSGSTTDSKQAELAFNSSAQSLKSERASTAIANYSVDTTFNPGLGIKNSSYAYKTAIQPDGKILIGGGFEFYDNIGRNHIARINPDGSLDTTFNPGSGADSFIEDFAIQPNGKILIAGGFTSYNGVGRNHIARINPDGSLDTTFNPGSGAGNPILALTLQSDGKILIGGWFTSYNGISRWGIARINTDGSLDTTFNPGSGANTVRAITIQSDGKILVSGDFTTYNGINRNRIARINPDGSLDATFNPGSGAGSSIKDLTLQSDGKILIGGEFTVYNGINRNRIARINTDGSLDTTFDPGSGASSGIEDIAIQSDGKILIVGGFTSYNGINRNRIARINSDGSLDTTFNPGFGSNFIIYSLALQLDGKVLVGGNFSKYNGLSRYGIIRINTDGSLDTSFNPGWGVLHPGSTYDLAVQSDGKILICGGFISYNGISRNSITRINTDGSLDTTFNPGSAADGTAILGCAIQPNGKIIIVGNFASYNGISRGSIARINTDGSLDNTFNSGFGANNVIYSLALQSDGKVLIGGAFTSYKGINRNGIARINTDGSLDTTFNPGSGVNVIIYSLAQQSDGKILIGGAFTSYNGINRNRIARVNSDGSLDTTFDPGSGVSGSSIYSLAQQSDGKILIGGSFTSYNGINRNDIARINTDGSLDTTFNPGSGVSGSVDDLLVQPDGKILIGGNFTSYNGVNRNHIARINTDGSLDTTFDPGSGADRWVQAIAIQSDGKILISGWFTSFDGISINSIARLLNNCCPVPPRPGATLGSQPNAGTFADPVNTATGNFVFDKSDLKVSGRGFGFEFKRFYNSQDSTSGPLGANWTHSYNLTVTENTTDNTVTIRLEDGHDEQYQYNGAVYLPKDIGVYNKLTKNADNTFTFTTKDQRKYNFNANGKLASIADRNNNIATFDYNANNQLSRVNIPGGRIVDFTYDANNRITQITDDLTPTPRTVSYEYDANNNLIAVIDPNGKRYEYTYDAQHQMLTAKDPRQNTFVTNTYDNARRVVTYQTDAKGNPTSFEYIESEGKTKITDAAGNISYDYHDEAKRMIRRQDKNGNSYSYTYWNYNNARQRVTDKNNKTTNYEYDTNGNVTKQTDPFGNTVIITYNANNDPLSRTDELGNVTTFEYDANGNLKKTTEPLGKITSFTYDSFGQLETITDAENHLTTNTYDSFGNLIKVKNHLNQETNYGYDSIGRRTSVTDALNRMTAFIYDKNNNLLSVTDPLNRTIAYEYDGNNNRTKITDPRNNSTRFEYDENNLLKKTIDARGGETVNTYNNLDRLISVKDARNNTTSFEYDADGRLKKVTDALGNVTQYEYDSQGNRTKTIDPKGKATVYAYDALNRLISVTDPLGNKTTNTYDALGRLTKTTDANNKTTQNLYDALGRLTKVTDADGKDAEYTYDKVGNRLTVKINNTTTIFTYDELNRLKTRKNPLNKIYEYSYDAAGNLISRKDANLQTTGYEYYNDNRLKKITYPNNMTVELEYDANGSRTKMTDALGVSTYVYDELNRLTNYVDAYGKSIGYEYDANSNRTALIYPDGKRVNYVFDAANRLTNVTDWGNRATVYSYDAASLLSGVTNSNGTTSAFDYDFAQRLISMSNKKSDQTVISSYNFTLDGVGNRTNVTANEAITAGVNQTPTNYTYNAANQIQSAGTTNFTSDNNGNLKTQTTGGMTINYNYDFEDRLTNVTDGTSSAQYIYNGDGQRLARISGGETTRFVLDPTARLPRVLAETDASGNIKNYYTHGLGLIARIRLSGQVFQYHFDQRGSTVAITNASQTIVNRYAYDAFGAVTAQSEQTTNSFHYMGQFGVTAEPFNLLFASRRFYNPTLGRFLTKDPVEGISGNPQTFNEYIYSLNNPIILIDPSGLSGQKDGSSRFEQNGSSDQRSNRFLNRLGNAVTGALKDTYNFLGCGFSLGQASNACIQSLDPLNQNPELAEQGAAWLEYFGRVGSLISPLNEVYHGVIGEAVVYKQARREGATRIQAVGRVIENNLTVGAITGKFGDIVPIEPINYYTKKYLNVDITHPFSGFFGW